MRTKVFAFRLLVNAAIGATLGALSACSAAETGQHVGAEEQAGSGGSSETGGSSGTTGGGGSGGSVAMGTGGTANAGGGGAAGSGGSSTAGSGGLGGSATIDASMGMDVGMPAGNFTCTQVTGLLVTQEWWQEGFETKIAALGLDTNKWQGKFQHYGYIQVWAMDTGFTWAAPLTSACTTKSVDPDRVIWTAWDWEITDESIYVSTTVAGVNQFKMRYPSMRRMDLMTIVRCPNNMMCNPNAKTIAGQTNATAGLQDCYVRPMVDSALQKVADQFPGLVYIAPKFFSPACRSPVDGGHLGTTNNQAVASDIAKYYATMP
jgi:hypothetical protein